MAKLNPAPHYSPFCCCSGPPKLRPLLLWGTPSHVLFWLGTPPSSTPGMSHPPRQGVSTHSRDPPLQQRTSSRGSPSTSEQDATPSPHHHSQDPTHRAPPEQGGSPPPSPHPLSAHPGQDATPHSGDLPSDGGSPHDSVRAPHSDDPPH